MAPAMEPTAIPAFSPVLRPALEAAADGELVGDCVSPPLGVAVIVADTVIVEGDADEEDVFVESTCPRNSFGMVTAESPPQQSVLTPQHHFSLELVPSHGVICTALPTFSYNVSQAMASHTE